jgi:hypothetical protein
MHSGLSVAIAVVIVSLLCLSVPSSAQSYRIDYLAPADSGERVLCVIPPPLPPVEARLVTRKVFETAPTSVPDYTGSLFRVVVHSPNITVVYRANAGPMHPSELNRDHPLNHVLDWVNKLPGEFETLKKYLNKLAGKPEADPLKGQMLALFQSVKALLPEVIVEQAGAEVARTALLLESGKTDDATRRKWRMALRKQFRPDADPASIETNLWQSLEKLEQVANDQPAICNPADSEVVMTAIAGRIPSPFIDSLFYAYGLSTWSGKARIDLHPGMRIRVEHSVFQLLPPKVSPPPSPEYQGYASAGASTYMVSRLHENGSLTLDSFVGMLRSLEYAFSSEMRPKVVPPLYAAGMINATAHAAKYGRLILPAMMFSSKEIGSAEDALSGGYKHARFTCSLIFGNLLEDMDNAILEGYGTSTVAYKDPQPPFRVIPRGQGVIVPEIFVRVNNQDRWYSVGTTLGDILREAGLHSPSADRQFDLQRQVSGGRCHVEFLNASSVEALPLLNGDSIKWQN